MDNFVDNFVCHDIQSGIKWEVPTIMWIIVDKADALFNIHLSVVRAGNYGACLLANTHIP